MPGGPVRAPQNPHRPGPSQACTEHRPPGLRKQSLPPGKYQLKTQVGRETPHWSAESPKKGLTALSCSELGASRKSSSVACSFPVLGWGLRPLPLSHTTNQGVVLWHEGFSDHSIEASEVHSLLLHRTQSGLRLRPLPLQNPSSALGNAQSSPPPSCCAGAPCWPGLATSSLELSQPWS